MVIHGTNGFDATKAYTNQLQKQDKAQAGKPAAADKSTRTDILDISSEARQAQVYRAALKDLPEVREDLVASLKAQIQAGTYKPDPAKIAQGIIEDK